MKQNVKIPITNSSKNYKPQYINMINKKEMPDDPEGLKIIISEDHKYSIGIRESIITATPH